MRFGREIFECRCGLTRLVDTIRQVSKQVDAARRRDSASVETGETRLVDTVRHVLKQVGAASLYRRSRHRTQHRNLRTAYLHATVASPVT